MQSTSFSGTFNFSTDLKQRDSERSTLGVHRAGVKKRRD